MHFFEKKLTLLANVFPKLRTRKEGLSKVFKKWRFTVAFEKQHDKGAQTHLKSLRQHLYHTYWSSIWISSLKKSLLVIFKMLWLFVNTFTGDEKYSPLNRDNFTQTIWMVLSQKRKDFSEFFSSVLKSTLNFEHFQKKVDPHS